MRRRGKAVKTQRRRTLKRHNTSKNARGRSSPTTSRQTDVVRLTRERDEALEQRAATAEVLKLISRSTFDLQTVLDALVASAVRLCEAERGVVFRREGEFYKSVAYYNYPREFQEFHESHPITPGRGTAVGRAALEGKTIQIVDILADPEYTFTEAQKLGRGRATLAVPLLREATPIGALALQRTEPRPYSPKQIELVETFAAQAVIAIENTQLLKELRQRTEDLGESLQQQTATSDVLQVISSSPGDLQPVFETMLENAVRICDAKFGKIRRWDGEVFYLVATHNAPSASANARRHSQLHPIPGTPIGRMVATKAVIHVADLAVDPGYIEQRSPSIVAAVELEGVRTILYVPILKETELIGAFTLSRQEVRPFNDKQVELVTNFARQAVIAIENTRLLNELRESLQQQTATADVLKVISRSTIDAKPDLEPVLETLLESAIRLCGATRGHVYRYDGEFLRFAASSGAWAGFRDFLQANPLRREGARLLEGLPLIFGSVMFTTFWRKKIMRCGEF